MSDIIQLLPESVANQIAAGEVVQGAYSIVKELTENAIDAGATQIIINIKDAGRTLIQVSDNGCGMSATDARMAFERHATSKIRKADDLFAIRTMGFRGEALASIAAVADVELHTRLHDEPLGTFLHIAGSRMFKQEPVNCSAGSNFMIKNLFFNIPARRKFLKKDRPATNDIITEVQRIALANTDVAISLINNQIPVYEMQKAEPLRKRIATLFNKNTSQNLIPIDTATSIVNVSGYIGQPSVAKKTRGEQFFFVNKRFMKSPFFQRAVMNAYEKIIPKDHFPSFFIYLDVDTAKIDINIHPTKTEIKFEDETAIWQIIHVAVRESLGKYNIVPSIDFDQSGNFGMPTFSPTPNMPIEPPKISYNPNYNPFNTESATNPPSQTKHWEKLYKDFYVNVNPMSDRQATTTSEVESDLPDEDLPDAPLQPEDNNIASVCFQFKNKYLLMPVKSGLMLINQRRAHERILFENFMAILENHITVTQQELFPQTIDLQAADAELLRAILDDLKLLGFNIEETETNRFCLRGIPAITKLTSSLHAIEELLHEMKTTATDMKEKMREHLAASLAKASAIPYGYRFKPDEPDEFIGRLFACSMPNFTPDGKKVLTIIPMEQIDKILT
ncbi:MAG: DNA mismatch repair endonuclease MutL [Bacteroidales bacterium]|jgi:DNA mismatch repair protein MutL|nr:DNA mismatch repair endonuclease MutL [Bacteroidales bacterium]